MSGACDYVKCYYADLEYVGLRATNSRLALVLGPMPPSKEKLIYRLIFLLKILFQRFQQILIINKQEKEVQ